MKFKDISHFFLALSRQCQKKIHRRRLRLFIYSRTFFMQSHTDNDSFIRLEVEKSMVVAHDAHPGHDTFCDSYTISMANWNKRNKAESSGNNWITKKRTHEKTIRESNQKVHWNWEPDLKMKSHWKSLEQQRLEPFNWNPSFKSAFFLEEFKAFDMNVPRSETGWAWVRMASGVIFTVSTI